MTPEELCSAYNHSWLCLKGGYNCTTCKRKFPPGIWANVKDIDHTLLELPAKASCPGGNCEI